MNNRKDLSKELAAAQERLGQDRGPEYWRTLEELAQTPAFQEVMRLEFPEQADIWPDHLSRRKFLTLMGASLALAGVAGCSTRPAPSVELTPYVNAPEELVPGKPLFYATTMTMAGSAVGLLVEQHEGRPTKIEGNPDHPASGGATDIYHQASILTLYDPDRAPNVTILGKTTSWEAAFAFNESEGEPRTLNGQLTLGQSLSQQRQKKGSGLRILTEGIVSPTLAAQLEQLLGSRGPYSQAKWHVYEPCHSDNAVRGMTMAYGTRSNGRVPNSYYDLSKADVVVSLDDDFLSCGPGRLNDVRGYMSKRRVRTAEAGQAKMNRLYVAESNVTTTGAKADHRLAIKAGLVESVARALAAEVGVEGAGAGTLEGDTQRWVQAAAADLKANRGKCVVLAGDRQPPAVHLLAHVLNSQLGNVGQTIHYTEPIEAHPAGSSGEHVQSLKQLVDAMNAGHVELLLILGANPVFTAPADLNFDKAILKVPVRAHLSLYQDETSRLCQWFLPEAHYLEAWGDARAFDGTASIVQPLIAPLYHGRSVLEFVAMLGEPAGRFNLVPGLQLVRNHWQQHWRRSQGNRGGGTRGRGGDQGGNQSGSEDDRQLTRQEQKDEEAFDVFWQIALHNGVIPDTKLRSLSGQDLRLRQGWEQNLQQGGSAQPSADDIELVLVPDPTIYDGRFANNGWLQELPKPITTVTWDNAALMSPNTAKALNVGKRGYAHGGEHGGYSVSMIKIQANGGWVEAPVWVVPGHADNSITVSLGYGRQFAGRVGGMPDERVGFNSYALRTSTNPWLTPKVEITNLHRTYLLACTQGHQVMEGRAPVQAGTLAEFKEEPGFAKKKKEEEEAELSFRSPKPLDLYPNTFSYENGPNHPRRKWGMVIDLTACVGCKACVVACQAENNIPVVGKDQVLAGREMHWLRIDLYHKGKGKNEEIPTEFYFQPVPCMHCENAPCEYVCPVEATVHSADGLNDMIYQRCVGTRFCSNNCPYKVRRFNFFLYADWDTPSKKLQYNPDVTVRSRGVMEKCSYCVQRIRHAEIDAQVEKRHIYDKEVLTACQAACPADAIVFGMLNHEQITGEPSEVEKLHALPTQYALLDDLNTHPRTTYLAALRNPNPDLEPKTEPTHAE